MNFELKRYDRNGWLVTEKTTFDLTAKDINKEMIAGHTLVIHTYLPSNQASGSTGIPKGLANPACHVYVATKPWHATLMSHLLQAAYSIQAF